MRRAHPGLRRHADDPHPDRVGRRQSGLRRARPRRSWPLSIRLRRAGAHRACVPRVGGGAQPRDRVDRRRPRLGPRAPAGGSAARSPAPAPDRRIDPVAAFREVRRIELRAGETLIEAGTPSRLRLCPAGRGAARATARRLRRVHHPGRGSPSGSTGVIRGAARNSERARPSGMWRCSPSRRGSSSTTGTSPTTRRRSPRSSAAADTDETFRPRVS